MNGIEERKSRLVGLPDDNDQTVSAVTEFHTQHRADATPLQRLLDRIRSGAGNVAVIVAFGGLVILWIALNLGLTFSGREPYDAPPFFWLQGCVSLTALFTTLLILITQKREDELALRREQLAMELAVLSERKSAKIIELIESLRRDHPEIADRVDREANAMATPTDTKDMVKAINAKKHRR